MLFKKMKIDAKIDITCRPQTTSNKSCSSFMDFSKDVIDSISKCYTMVVILYITINFYVFIKNNSHDVSFVIYSGIIVTSIGAACLCILSLAMLINTSKNESGWKQMLGYLFFSIALISVAFMLIELFRYAFVQLP